jgi:hypothetical protein
MRAADAGMYMIIQKPDRLPAHATMGIVAPSLPLLPSWQEQYAAGKRLLSSWGFELREGATLNPVAMAIDCAVERTTPTLVQLARHRQAKASPV